MKSNEEYNEWDLKRDNRLRTGTGPEKIEECLKWFMTFNNPINRVMISATTDTSILYGNVRIHKVKK